MDQNETSTFEVGDWIIIKDSLVVKLKEGSNKRTIDFIESLVYPEKIIEIQNRDKENIVTIYKLESSGKLLLEIEKYRLATNKEIKNQQLKEMFIEIN